tara:strand:+ start:144 stop:269 length:126 start_codon:yes stop_codon:yes gene_type:complete
MDETGNLLAVLVSRKSSNAKGVASTGQDNNGTSGTGAVYVY